MPYVPDVGAECSSFTHPGVLDGADETISHEYAEVLTDPFPVDWMDRPTRQRGRRQVREPHRRLTRWIDVRDAGDGHLRGTGDLGQRPRQERWLRKRPRAHLDASTPGSEGRRRDPREPSGQRLGRAGRSLTYTAAGLPAGLTINATSGLISGTPQARGRSMVTIVVSYGAATSTITFDWTIRR